VAETALPPAPRSQTPRRLRRFQMIAVAVLVAVGVLGAVGCVQLREELASGPSAVAQNTRLGTVEYELITARNLTARHLLAPSANTEQALTDTLAGASTQLTAAAAAQPADATALDAINSQLLAYSYQLQTARAATTDQDGQDALAKADRILDQSLSVQLAQLRATQSARAASAPFWIWAGLAAALFLLIWINIALARLSRRFINLGMIGATVCLLAVGGVVGLANVKVASATNTSAAALSNSAEVINTRLTLATIDRALLKGVQQRSWTLAEFTQVTDSIRTANKSANVVKGLGTSFSAQAKVASTVMEEVNSTLWAKEWDAADKILSTQGSQAQALSGFDQQVANLSTDQATQTSNAASNAAALLLVGAFGSAALALVGAVLAIWGLNRRLVEYR
jgi:hypothetical protein